jgi:hypothetical protein
VKEKEVYFRNQFVDKFCPVNYKFQFLTFVVSVVALCRWSIVKISDLWPRLSMEAERNVRTWHTRVSWSHFLLDIWKFPTLGMKWVWHLIAGVVLGGFIAIRKHLSTLPPLKLCQEKLNLYSRIHKLWWCFIFRAHWSKSQHSFG